MSISKISLKYTQNLNRLSRNIYWDMQNLTHRMNSLTVKKTRVFAKKTKWRKLVGNNNKELN